jgi:uncharacterized protein (DUF58 family)
VTQHGINASPEPILSGAYVDLADLLAIRYRASNLKQTPPPVVGTQGGSRLSKLRGRGIDFSEVRAYQPGDDVRTIDWRVTARKNKPHTKVFREERERLTLVVVDQTQSMFFGSQVRLKSVAAAEVAATAAWQALAHNDRVGGMIIGNEQVAIHKPFRNVKAVARLLADVARFNQDLRPGAAQADGGNLRESLVGLRRLAHTNYRIYLVSDFEPMGDHWRDTFRALARHNEVIAVRVYDPLEQELPPADRYTVTDGRSRWQFHSGNRQLRQRYHDRFDIHEAEFKNICQGSRVRYRPLATNEPVGQLVRWS